MKKANIWYTSVVFFIPSNSLITFLSISYQMSVIYVSIWPYHVTFWSKHTDFDIDSDMFFINGVPFLSGPAWKRTVLKWSKKLLRGSFNFDIPWVACTITHSLRCISSKLVKINVSKNIYKKVPKSRAKSVCSYPEISLGRATLRINCHIYFLVRYLWCVEVIMF